MPKNKKLSKENTEIEEYGVTNIKASSKAEKQPSRRKIALDTLSRYSGSKIKNFQKYILLTNFPNYVHKFAEIMSVPVENGSVLHVAHAPKIKTTIIDYRVGAPMAALVMDVLSYTNPDAVVMLGMCGGLHRQQKIGDFLLPMAAIRDEGASRHYMPPQVPSLPAFLVQQFISQELLERRIPFHTGVVHTTDYRMWEFDTGFKQKLDEEKATAIDMECSSLFTVGFARKVPVGALMLVSDLPTQGGIKTKASAKKIFQKYTEQHLSAGIDSMLRLQSSMKSARINLRRYTFT